MSDTAALGEAGIEHDTWGFTILVFDCVKLALYSLYYGKQQWNDLAYFVANVGTGRLTGADYFGIVWNAAISVLNITNFVFFILLSRSYDVNEMLRADAFVDSSALYGYYWMAQLFDSMLVLMNIFNIVQFTVVSRRVSLVFKIIAITAPYLGYLIITYVSLLFLMAMLVWQVYGDKLFYFRKPSMSMLYTMALFDMKTMYLGKDFMDANQYGVEKLWLLMLVVLFSIVLHYTITLQYSAYFHIYYNISKKYEVKLQTTHSQYKVRGGVLKEWLNGIRKSPFASDEPEEDESATAKLKDKGKKK